MLHARSSYLLWRNTRCLAVFADIINIEESEQQLWVYWLPVKRTHELILKMFSVVNNLHKKFSCS